jgi:hypothetical protein
MIVDCIRIQTVVERFATRWRKSRNKLSRALGSRASPSPRAALLEIDDVWQVHARRDTHRYPPYVFLL